MKHEFKRFVSTALVMAMLISILAMGIPVTASAAPSFDTVGGWNETIYATIKGIADADVTAVSYSGPVSGSLTGEDFDYLVRSTSGGVRLDILGLKAGTYSLTVETTSGTVTQSNIEVPAQDRSGFAHDGYTEGVGAYNDDGTLKDNAIVLYVTNSNKNSLTLSCGGVTVAGIGHILNSCGADAGDGLTSKGGLANNNQGILKKLAEADIPLCVRIIGNVTTPDGVTEFDSINYGGIDNDNGSMCRMTNCKNITIEGVGASAISNGWGFSFIAGTGDTAKGYGKNFEVRNLRFENVPEDCVGLEGQQVGDELTDPIMHCWVHNNSFISPYFPDAPEADKRNGDGACDWKRGMYYTNSYNHYDGYKKTNLVGSNDDCLQYHATFHHNYWDDCAARAPLVRKADVHMYNNIWYSMVDYCISPRASSYVFYEYGYFVENGDVLETSGDTDGYANVYENNKNDPSGDVTDKAAAIKSGRLAGTYVERGDYSLQTDIEEMKQTVYNTCGSQRASGASSLDPDAPADESQTGGTAGGFVHNFTAHGLESAFYTITGNLATNKGKVTYNNLTLTQCLVMSDTAASVSFDAPVAGTLTMVFGGSTSDKNNTVLLDGSEVTIGSDNTFTVDVSAGSHTVVKDDVVHLWYIAYVPSEEVEEPTLAPTEHVHSHSASVTKAATCTEAGVRTYTCSCGDSYTEEIAALGHSYDNGYCTICGAQDSNSSHTHDYKAVVTAPGCESQGYTTYSCTCGDSYVADYTDATGHSYSSVVTAPSCTAQGYTTHTCSGCGDSYKDSYTAATGHSYKSVVTAPTCTAQGYTTHTCSACGSSYKDSYTAATGHSYVNGKCSACGRSESISSDVLEAAGHLESAYAEWSIISGADGYNVYVKKSGGSYTQIDTELIRQYPDRMRADAVGLAAGTYMLKIVPVVDGVEQTSAAMETGDLTVLAHDRSGYAFHGGYNVGAYNADGTLKSNAKVFYITKDTVNTVTITENGKTYTGLGKLVKEYARTTSYPIVIRIIGEIPVPSATTNGQIEVKGNIVPVTIEGIGEDATCNRWGFKLSACENVEVRNLGFMNNDSSEGDSLTLQGANRSWVHNCDFFYGEPGSDADQVKGDGALDTKHSEYVTHSYNHFWDCGKVNLQGSGSSDTSNYITYHHNWYDHSDSRHPRVRIASVHVYNNYYDGNAGYGVGAACASDVFVENNYFRNCDYPMLTSDQGSDTTETMSGEPGGMIKAYGNVIVGETSFIPYTSGSTSFDAYVASSRDEQVPSSVKATNGGATYNNFDTAADFYDYTPDTAQVGAEKTVAYAGRVGGGDFQWEFNDAVDDDSEEVIAELKSALLSYKTTLVSVGGNSVVTTPEPTDPTDPEPTDPTDPDPTDPVVTEPTDPVVTEPTEETTEPTEAPTQPTVPGNVASQYIHDFTANGLESDFYTITGELSTGKGTVSYDGKTLTRCLKLDKSTSNVTFDAPYSGTLTMIFGGSTSDRNKKVLINGTGYTIDTNSHLTVEIEAGSHTVTRSSSSVNLWYVVYTPDIPEAPVVEPFSVAGVNLALNNDITLYLYLMAENYDASYTMEITKSYADGREVTKTVAAADWENYYGTMYRVGFNGIAAKEMTDEITVTVYDASGNAVSKEFVTTVADAAVLVYKSEANAASFTMMADLLNYGAAAQGNFRYNTDDLANTRLTAEQAAYASARFDMSTVTGKASGTAGAMGATLYLDTNIQHNFIFDAAVVDSTMTAKVSYTNYKGVANSFTIPGSRFVNNGSMITVNVSALTPADVNVPVTVQIVDANGAAVCSLTDSIAWYCVRAQASATNDLFIELMEFATSCNAYFG